MADSEAGAGFFRREDDDLYLGIPQQFMEPRCEHPVAVGSGSSNADTVHLPVFRELRDGFRNLVRVDDSQFCADRLCRDKEVLDGFPFTNVLEKIERTARNMKNLKGAVFGGMAQCGADEPFAVFLLGYADKNGGKGIQGILPLAPERNHLLFSGKNG